MGLGIRGVQTYKVKPHALRPEQVNSISNMITKNRMRWNYRHTYKPDSTIVPKKITHIVYPDETVQVVYHES